MPIAQAPVVAFAAWLAVLVSIPARAGDLVIEHPVSPRTAIPVAPGASADWQLSVRNDGAAPVMLATLRAFAAYGVSPPSAWQFGPPTSPECGAVRLVTVPITPDFGFWAWEVDVTDLAPGQRRSCVYPLLRSASSTVDRVLTWEVIAPPDDPGPAGNAATWVAGAPTRLQLTATPTCDGSPAPGTQHVRIALANRGPTAVDALVFGTCVPPFPPYSVTGNLAGGCGDSQGAPGACFMGGRGWRLDAVAPGQTRSCLLALSAPSGTGGWPLRLAPPYRSGELYVHDLEPDQAMLSLSMTQPPLTCGGPAPPTAAAVPGPRDGWLLALAALLLLLAVVHSRAAGPGPSRRRR
jgi:hypothetical protein